MQTTNNQVVLQVTKPTLAQCLGVIPRALTNKIVATKKKDHWVVVAKLKEGALAA